MHKSGPFQGVSLPNDWPDYIKLAVIQTIALAHRTITYGRSYAINSRILRVRLAGELDRERGENALLREELRIKDARMGKLEPRKRPHYTPTMSATLSKG